MPGVKELIKLPGGAAFRLLKWDEKLSDVFWIISPGKTSRIHGEGCHWHYHQALELTLFTAGRGTRFVGDRIQNFEPGEIVLLGENLPHYWHTLDSSSGLSVQFLFAATHPVWGFPESVALAPLIKASSRGIHYYGASADALIARLHALAAAEGLDQLGLFLQLLGIAASAPQSDRQYISNQTFSLSGDSAHQNAMRAAMRFILTNYKEDVSLKQLLEVTRMSKPTFSRYFKRHSGKTLGKFLQQIRVEAACRELKETQKTVIEVALSCGFSQISFFNRVFQRMMRCTPTRYRERQHR
jgi:AraC-like DNA-binding protein/mannose-6-phosphate isomerase-like protein (cupin superfamily)